MLAGWRPISISCFRLVSVCSAVPGLCGASGLTAWLVTASNGSRGRESSTDREDRHPQHTWAEKGQVRAMRFNVT
jgi:hypothetical protein